MSFASISELADSIKANANILEEYLKTNNLPPPSFDVNGPTNITIPTNELKVLKARGAVVSAAQELRNLVLGPTAVLMSIDVSSTSQKQSSGSLLIVWEGFECYRPMMCFACKPYIGTKSP
jgi:hypothetical protein